MRHRGGHQPCPEPGGGPCRQPCGTGHHRPAGNERVPARIFVGIRAGTRQRADPPRRVVCRCVGHDAVEHGHLRGLGERLHLHEPLRGNARLNDGFAAVAHAHCVQVLLHAFEQALRDYGITETQLKEHMLWQLTVLRFVDYRFRPGIQIPDSDIEAYYQQQLDKWKAQGNQPAPSPGPQSANQQQLERLAKAADKVLDKIQTEESVLYSRLNYFEKPERLDPSSYASKD